MSTTTVEHGSAQHQPDWEPLRSSVTTAVAAQLIDPAGLAVDPGDDPRRSHPGRRSGPIQTCAGGGAGLERGARTRRAHPGTAGGRR